MNEFKGTPGPWFGDSSRAIGPKSTEDDQSYGMVIPVGWVEFDPEIEVQVANQRIMASSPRLLELLIKCVDALDEVSHQSWCGQIIDEARAEIAKALGESQ